MFEERDRIEVESDGITRAIVLAKGDLARIDPGQGVDLLVISTLPGDYSPTPTSLVGQLAARGISVERLAAMKAMDLRADLGVWLSHPVDDAGFERLVCFEPMTKGAPPDVVGMLFRALFPILGHDGEHTIAMPLIAAGDAGWPAEQMLPPLLEAAAEWLRLGLPIATLYIVERSEAKLDRMGKVFAEYKQSEPLRPDYPHEAVFHRGAGSPVDPSLAPRGSGPDSMMRKSASHISGLPLLVVVAALGAVILWVLYSPATLSGDGGGSFLQQLLSPVAVFTFFGLLAAAALFAIVRHSSAGSYADLSEFDDLLRNELRAKPRADTKRVFLSFSSKDAAAADAVGECLSRVAPHVDLYDFRRDVQRGTRYQRKIDAALKDSEKVVCLFSPDYMRSGECQEELEVTRLRNKRQGFDMLVPVYWRRIEGDLEDWIVILDPADCREANERRLADEIRHLARRL